MNKYEVAETILDQLGGNRFCVMTGAKMFVADKNSLSFRIGRNSKNVNYVKIELLPSDTYKMTFMFVSSRSDKIKAEKEGIYADMLQDVFTMNTGMYTHL